MRTRPNVFLKALLMAALFATLSTRIYAQTPDQNFSWTVTGTGTETWFTDDLVYRPVSLSVNSPQGGTDGLLSISTNVIAPLSGTCSFSYTLNYLNSSWGGASVYIRDVTTLTDIMSDDVGNYTAVPYNRGLASFAVVAGHNYYIYVSASGHISTINAPGNGSGSAQITLNFPDHLQHNQHTSARTATMNGNGIVNATDGQKNLGGFYAPPAPQNGGTISGATYTLAWNNVNVLMLFSDTLGTATTNPNAFVIAVTPGAYGGTPQTLPGRIHLERYDTGGQNVAYHDADAYNWGNWRLTEGVDLVYDTNSGAAMIGWCEPGEWVKFSVNVQKSTNYTVVFWQGALGKGGTNFLAVDGNVVTGPLVVPDTGSWTVFQPVRNHNVFISAGFHIFQLYEQNYTTAAVGMGDISAIDIVEYPQITQPPISQTASLKSNATMSVTASGTALAYQWYFNSNSIAGATNAVLALTNLQLAQSGQYGATCSNAAAVVASANATLTVTQSPQILTSAATFGIRTNRFGFAVAGYSNLVVVVEACTNLSNANWIALQTNTLGTNTWYFNDNGWTNYRNRYYRVRTQ